MLLPICRYSRVSLWKEKLRWNECRKSSWNECTQKEVQRKKDMTADGQDYRSSFPWEEGKDGEVKWKEETRRAVATERKRNRYSRMSKSRSRKRVGFKGCCQLALSAPTGGGLDCSGYAAAWFEFAPRSARLATSSFTCMDLGMGPEQVSSMSFPRWQMVGTEN